MNKNEKFYIKLRTDISDWLQKNTKIKPIIKEYILIIPDIFYLLLKLVKDKDVPYSKKIKLFAAITYFISPIDIIPEAFLGPIGYLDDLGLAAFVLNDLINSIDPQIIKRNWPGENDILILIKNILANIDKLIGKGIWQKLKKLF
ncbi:MAG: hypothetical protein CR986_03475 [Ignavibacteriae bacterium]|nr:MAG: hypothetical protein CR986_03475 [Ignavibacteriota bacterium]